MQQIQSLTFQHRCEFGEHPPHTNGNFWASMHRQSRWFVQRQQISCNCCKVKRVKQTGIQGTFKLYMRWGGDSPTPAIWVKLQSHTLYCQNRIKFFISTYIKYMFDIEVWWDLCIKSITVIENNLLLQIFQNFVRGHTKKLRYSVPNFTQILKMIINVMKIPFATTSQTIPEIPSDFVE